MRLVLHTAAYWLMLDVRDAIPKIRDLASAEFTSLCLQMLRVAARIVETRQRVCIALEPDPKGS
ncbi:MAG: transposase [Janthinobacterium lividum]